MQILCQLRKTFIHCNFFFNCSREFYCNRVENQYYMNEWMKNVALYLRNLFPANQNGKKPKRWLQKSQSVVSTCVKLWLFRYQYHKSIWDTFLNHLYARIYSNAFSNVWSQVMIWVAYKLPIKNSVNNTYLYIYADVF